MNPILQLAEDIRNATNHICEVGPGPFGFGVSTNRGSDLYLVLSFDPAPIADHIIFPKEIKSYTVKVVGYSRGEDHKPVSLEELSGYASSEQNSDYTRTVASAILELGKEPIRATADECHEAFSLMAKYALDNDKGFLNIGPYTPPDGAALRYSRFCLYLDGEAVGGGCREGHTGLEDILAESFITNHFSRHLSLREITVTVNNYTYGKGSTIRDVNEEEFDLAIRGAFDDLAQEASQQFVIARSDVSLPPVSPLTSRGMSLFFSAAADQAEQMGFNVDGIENGQLQISKDGSPVIMLYEDGCGSHIYLHDKEPFFVLFPTGPYVPTALSVGQDGLLNDKIRDLLAAVKKLRGEIHEILYPADYPYAGQLERAAEEQTQGLTIIL